MAGHIWNKELVFTEDWPSEALRSSMPELYGNLERRMSFKKIWKCERCGTQLLANSGEKQRDARKRNRIPFDCDISIINSVSSS